MKGKRPDREQFLREVGNLIARAERAATAKGQRVVVFGEMVAILWKDRINRQRFNLNNSGTN